MLPSCAKTNVWAELMQAIASQFKVPVVCSTAIFGKLSFFQELRNRTSDSPYASIPGARYVSVKVEEVQIVVGPFRTNEPHALDEELADAREKLPLWKEEYEKEIIFNVEQAAVAAKNAFLLEQSLSRAKLLLEFSQGMTSAKDIEHAMQQAMQFLVNKFKLGNVVLCVNGKLGRYFDVSEAGKQAEARLLAHIKQTKTHCVIQNVQTDFLLKDLKDLDKLPHSMLGFPLVVNREFIGHVIAYTESIPSFEGISEVLYEFISVIARLSEYKKAQDSAITDALTGLNNRGNIAKLDALISHQESENLPTSVLMIDADNFKGFNDAQGHPEGDRVLRMIADILKAVMPKESIVYRYGGEEFLVALPLSGMDAKDAAEKLRQKIEEICPLTASIGLFTCMNSSVSREMMIKEADTALYHSKHMGKNKVIARVMIDKLLGIIDG